MTDDDSPIIDFYPEDFDIDMNGKKMAWQGVALLPFIDQTRLLAALDSRESLLTDDEKRRNSWGEAVMFVAGESPLYDSLGKLYTTEVMKNDLASRQVSISFRNALLHAHTRVGDSRRSSSVARHERRRSTGPLFRP